MQKLKRFFCVVIFCLLAVSVGMSQEAGAARDDKKSEAQIRQALADWVAAANRRDLSAASSIWASNVVGWFPSSEEFTLGAAYAVAGLPQKPGSSYSTYEIKIDEIVVSDSLAAVHDIWTETRHFDGSNVIVRRLIRGSEMWRRQADGKRKIARWVSAPEKWIKASEK